MAAFVSVADRYGGLEVELTEAVTLMPPAEFESLLRAACDDWIAQGKKGVWLKVPLACGGGVGGAAANGFVFHHAQPDYAMMTRWLPPNVPSTLPKYGFTQVGVGGVVRASSRVQCSSAPSPTRLSPPPQVVNTRNEVLMVQEAIAPMPQFQGCWKLPGGLADPGEDFAETAIREVS